MDLKSTIKDIVNVDLWKEAKNKNNFVGRPFYIDYEKVFLLISDSWKNKVGGIPQGSLLLAFYENEKDVSEALLLRALKPTKLPTDNDVISSMIEYYKDNQKTAGNDTQLDDFTRYEFSFSGLECRILGTFYNNKFNKIIFGADVENFYSSHNYLVYKASDKVLEFIVNLRDDDSIAGSKNDFKIGKVRYSSSLRFQDNFKDVPIYISPTDFLGKRTALFGMTRTGKSNTVKKIIEATHKICLNSKVLGKTPIIGNVENINPFEKDNSPKYKAGQIIFDINGEYANANLQDELTAIFDLYSDYTVRYSILEKQSEDFKIMKVNFYNDIETGFEYVVSSLKDESGDYVTGFSVVNLDKPDPSDFSAQTRYLRKVSVYLCCLYKAGFAQPENFKVKFEGNDDLNKIVEEQYGKIEPSKKIGISLDQATNWWKVIWENRNIDFFSSYRKSKGHDWIDEELSSLLTFLTQVKPTGQRVSGYTKLKRVLELHTNKTESSFQKDILDFLRDGKIVIIDLSQGDPKIQSILSERICNEIFSGSMRNFTQANPNNFIQLYFEEAHNLFPKREDKNLSQIYNRIAKEGAKLNLGLIYATQEVSSISSNILKNTQNWFIAHLNNDDEIKELKKYYDFSDFSESLIKFSSSSDKGFVRMKTYSNPFVVPAQIDRFLADRETRI